MTFSHRNISVGARGLGLALVGWAAATFAARAADGDDLDGFLPATAPAIGDTATVMDPARAILRADPAMPDPEAVARAPKTPGEAVLAERTRVRRAVDGLGALLIARRPDVLRARFEALRPAGGRVVALPFRLDVDADAYARLAADFVQAVRAYTGAEGVLVDMPVHAERLAMNQLWLGPPWAVDGERRVAYEGGMTLMVCESFDPEPRRAVWPGDAEPVGQHNARWRVFDLDPDLMRGLIQEAVARHPFRVSAMLCDAEGNAVESVSATPHTATYQTVYPVEGLYIAPTPNHLVVMPWLTGRSPEGPDGFVDLTESTLDLARRLPPVTSWSRIARFALDDDALARVALYRCAYTTACRAADTCAHHAGR